MTEKKTAHLSQSGSLLQKNSPLESLISLSHIKQLNLTLPHSVNDKTQTGMDDFLWGCFQTPHGKAYVCVKNNLICHFGFYETEQHFLQQCQSFVQKRNILRAQAQVSDQLEMIFRDLTQEKPVALDVYGTVFQRRVWQCLLSSSPGQCLTYKTIAQHLGGENFARAVARAVASNPVAILIPCHRVIRSDGKLAGYRWGPDKKKQLLNCEVALASAI